MTYMASCGDTTCDKFDSRDAQWFKIDEAGKKSDGSTWIQQDISEYSVPVCFGGEKADEAIGDRVPQSCAPCSFCVHHSSAPRLWLTNRLPQ